MEDDCPVKSIHAKLDKEVCAFEKVLLRENCEDTMSFKQESWTDGRRQGIEGQSFVPTVRS